MDASRQRTAGPSTGAILEASSTNADPPTTHADADSSTETAPKLQQSLEQFELAFEEEMAAERRRRVQLRQRAVNRSKARRIVRTEQRGKVRFSVLVVALSFTVVTVVVVMFETLAWLMAPG